MKVTYNNDINSKNSYKTVMGIESNKSSKKIAEIYQGDKNWKVDLTNVLDGKNEAAYKEACENRRFEIEMYWKRATYFWAFIVSIYTAFFFISSKEGQPVIHKEIIKLALAFLGFVFCLGFYFANKGSKNWQENWEQHVNLLEDNVAGQLYKVFMRDDSAYSVSKINDFLSFVLSFFSGGFFVVVAVDFLNMHFKDILPLQKLGLFIIILVFTILIFLYMKFCLLGNQKDSKKIDFAHAEIED